MKHWSKFLPEVGRGVIMKADDLEILNLRVKDLEEKLDLAKKQFHDREEELLSDVVCDWKSEEIIEAKNKARKYNGS